jgi:hypothetical protein
MMGAIAAMGQIGNRRLLCGWALTCLSVMILALVHITHTTAKDNSLSKTLLACKLLKSVPDDARLERELINVDGNIGAQHQTVDDQYTRIISVGDVHGSLDGLLEILFHANVTAAPDVCEWRPDSNNVLLVQVGDIVDRGSQALAAWKCIDKLQHENVPDGSKVVRLVGNHEIWWLEGQFHHRNQQYE